MSRFRLSLVLALVLPIVGAACWLDVPNLQPTEGGYPPDQAAAGEAPAAQPSRAADTLPPSEAAHPSSAQ